MQRSADPSSVASTQRGADPSSVASTQRGADRLASTVTPSIHQSSPQQEGSEKRRANPNDPSSAASSGQQQLPAHALTERRYVHEPQRETIADNAPQSQKSHPNDSRGRFPRPPLLGRSWIFRYKSAAPTTPNRSRIPSKPSPLHPATRNVRRLAAALVIAAAPLAAILSAHPLPPQPPIDAGTTPETRHLLANLRSVALSEQILFGQEFPLSYRFASPDFDPDLQQSDSKDVTGDHPAVHGSDFHYILDKEPAEAETHKQAARLAYQAGGVVTFDFHLCGRYDDAFYYSEPNRHLLAAIANQDDSQGDLSWYHGILDQVLEIVNNDLGFPIVYRPFHEMNGNWFWWGSRAEGGPEAFRAAFRYTIDYLRERTDLMLFCWSPDKSFAREYYPGDAYVDILGFDGYNAGEVHYFSTEDMLRELGDITDFAIERGKVAAFTETGNNETYPNQNPTWWTEGLLHPILADERARRIAWILTWINAEWAGTPYIPATSSPQPAKEDFIQFKNHPQTLFLEDAAQLELYAPPHNLSAIHSE